MSNLSHLEEVNVLASDRDWAWPLAMQELFRPCGVNLLVAREAKDFVEVMARRRVHATIIDLESQQGAGLSALRLIRLEHPMLPCIVLKNRLHDSILEQVLKLDAFSVLDKPVDLLLLRRQLNRLFMRFYGSSVFE